MFLDKTETFVLNIGGLNKRKTRKNLAKVCKQINFCNSFKFSIFRDKHLFGLKINLPKQQLPYVISFLSFHKFDIYQILEASVSEQLIDSERLLLASKRFVLTIDGLRDAFIKDKIIDIINLINNTEDISYTFNKNKVNVNCSAAVFSRLINEIATHNIDILCAIAQQRVVHKARIS
ncbi:hypothetical protein MHZ36_02815 [Staphylococcus sp. ACRSN]|uniref:hypothetical protein n=1 Tax=Staphylococcus sp. ACRSN TaxID=2918214 RepID=UPI001EF33565|nr:hypothetical protein [Staphylococcus sp. ACRSN]MCG7338213.1 hypothetical protein [Staphylococcus sp. ACRSN]